MRIQCEAISQNHAFCIDKNSVKRLFADYDIEIFFKKGNVLPYKDAQILPEKAAKYHVATLYVSKPRMLQLGESNSLRLPLLFFYSVDIKYLSAELKEQFAQEILPKIYDQFISHKDDDYDVNGCEYSMSVYVTNGAFVTKENKKYSF